MSPRRNADVHGQRFPADVAGNAKEDLRGVIREKYGDIARQGGSCCGPSSCGCVAGAALVDDIRKMMTGAGLVDIVLEPKSGYIERMTESAGPLFGEIIGKLPAGTKLSDFVTSLNITARKPS